MTIQQLITLYKKYLEIEYNEYLQQYINKLELIEDKERTIKSHSVNIESNLIIHVFLLTPDETI